MKIQRTTQNVSTLWHFHFYPPLCDTLAHSGSRFDLLETEINFCSISLRLKLISAPQCICLLIVIRTSHGCFSPFNDSHFTFITPMLHHTHAFNLNIFTYRYTPSFNIALLSDAKLKMGHALVSIHNKTGPLRRNTKRISKERERERERDKNILSLLILLYLLLFA